MSTALRFQRLALRRGSVLRMLVEDYRAEMTSVRSLLGALDALGESTSAEDLAFDLKYLADAGYVQVWRNRDMPGWRNDRESALGRPEQIRFARLQPKGLQLIDGHTAEDPQVKF